MTKVTQHCFEATGRATFICDFSPPRSGDPQVVQQVLQLKDADFISVAYNPGRAVRASSALVAAAIRQQTGQEVVFTLATRDMNKLAIQSLLLGAHLMGLENLVVVQGDPFTPRDLEQVKSVGDFTPTGLLGAIAAMNRGEDYRGNKLASPTEFCAGATLDLGRGLEQEARLAHRKAQAGAQFLLAQPIFDPAQAARFQEACTAVAGGPLALPVFWGLQILEPDGVIFSSVPESVRRELAAGRSGVALALELYRGFQAAGLHNVYLVPPIRRGGARNYAAAAEFLERVRGG
jgi:5,10-methylenetetrahydrofolate reductase